jgi:hypothetical protein
MAYEVIVNQPGVYRILLEEREEGVYVNIFDSPGAKGPYIDHLQNDLDMAMRSCKQDYGIEVDMWKVCPNELWH